MPTDATVTGDAAPGATPAPGRRTPAPHRAGAAVRATAGALAVALAEALGAARGRLFVFVPVCLGLGIGTWFALPSDPGIATYGLAGAGAAAMLALALRLARAGAGDAGHAQAFRPLALAVALALAGLCLAGARAHWVAAPVLDGRYYGAITGRVIVIDRSLSDRTRLTLDRVTLERRDARRTPARVRVSLHGLAAEGVRRGLPDGAPPPADPALALAAADPRPGTIVTLTGHLAPPGGPVSPGGFDFRGMAWFDRLGAVGYTRSPVVELTPPARAGPGIRIGRLRSRIATAVQARIPGEAGAFAAAILTGDRSGIGRATLDDLRATNLAHLLAISGLHMGLLTGFVFAALRYGMALVPPLALRLPVKKIAAVAGLAAGAFYLALSGGNVATQRAYVMVAVMFVAVLADRRAISLRSVAMAAVIVLLLRPESLTGAGFQMSFAATVALVAAFGALARLPQAWRGPRLLRPVLAVVLSSLVAGLATAPVAAAHFNRIADYGLIANLAAVPLMGTVVMPAAVVAALLAPVGAAAPALWVMEAGIGWILLVARTVAGWEGALTGVPAPPPAVLPMLALGALWALVWPGRARLAGVVAGGAALVLWTIADRPAVLVAEGGAMVGVMGPEGRALSKPRGAGFVTRSWLEDDGDLALPADAAARGPPAADGLWRRTVAGTEVIHLFGVAGAARVAEACGGGAVVIVDRAVADPPAGDCQLFDAETLRATGALALHPGREGLDLRRAAEVAGRRPWTAAGVPPDRDDGR